MVYINNITLFPKVLNISPDEIVFFNQTNKKQFTQNVEDLKQSNKYYAFILDLSDFNVGQYNYTIYSNKSIIGQGMCQFGDFKSNKEEYNQTFKYKQYNG